MKLLRILGTVIAFALGALSVLHIWARRQSNQPLSSKAKVPRLAEPNDGGGSTCGASPVF